MKVLVAGFEHETNTFAPSKAAYENFIKGEGYPAMARGEDVLKLRDVNLSTGGFVKAIEDAGDTPIPVIWAGASASAHVTRDAYERIAGEIIEAARTHSFDAIYINLHGAMVPEHLDDGEGELLTRLRAVVGPEMPIFASVDLHANMTEEMLRQANGIVGYRTYPHIDLAETASKSVALFRRYEANGKRMFLAMRRIPFLIPIPSQCTMLNPAKAVYERLAELETGDVLSLSFAMGFPASDFPECGPVVWGYGLTQEAADRAVGDLHDMIVRAEAEWVTELSTPERAVAEAMLLAQKASKPIVISDTQDNPGAGGDANTTGMLRALVSAGAKRAALGVFYDPAAVAAAKAAGQGARITIDLGGQSGVEGDAPFHGTFEVEYLGDGRCVFDGPMFHGTQVDLGGVACLRIDDVRIIVSATKAQMFDRNLYRVGGVQPEEMKILVNKSSVHFRADFGPISEAILVAKAPGPMKVDPRDLPWTRLAEGMRITPMGEAFHR